MKPAKQTPEGVCKGNAFFPGGERSVNYKVALKPGEQYKLEPVDVRGLFELQLGSVYFVEVTYEERQEGGWTGRLISNKIRLEMKSK